MQQMLSIEFPKSEIKLMVQQQAERYFEELTTGKTWTLDEFRKNCCGGKSPNWVNLFIIFAKPACEWMEDNRDRIDWEAKLPRHQ